MKTGIEQIDDGFNWIDERKLRVCVDRDDNIKNVSKLRVHRNRLIFTEIDERLVYPVANAFEVSRFLIVFKDFKLEYL